MAAKSSHTACSGTPRPFTFFQTHHRTALIPTNCQAKPKHAHARQHKGRLPFFKPTKVRSSSPPDVSQRLFTRVNSLRFMSKTEKVRIIKKCMKHYNTGLAGQKNWGKPKTSASITEAKFINSNLALQGTPKRITAFI